MSVVLLQESTTICGGGGIHPHLLVQLINAKQQYEVEIKERSSQLHAPLSVTVEVCMCRGESYNLILVDSI